MGKQNEIKIVVMMGYRWNRDGIRDEVSKCETPEEVSRKDPKELLELEDLN